MSFFDREGVFDSNWPSSEWFDSEQSDSAIASASASFGTETIAALAASATGSAVAQASLDALVTMSALSANATGAGNASAMLGTETLSAPAASVAGNASASATLPTVNAGGLATTAVGDASAAGSLGTIGLSALSVNAAGDGTASAGFGAVVITAPEVEAMAVTVRPRIVLDVASDIRSSRLNAAVLAPAVATRCYPAHAVACELRAIDLAMSTVYRKTVRASTMLVGVYAVTPIRNNLAFSTRLAS